jgi:predicted RNase H-like HicB family nuclease
MGQLVDWPEVVTEGKTLEECRAMLADALREMIAAYRQQQKELPAARALLNAGTEYSFPNFRFRNGGMNTPSPHYWP